MKSKRDGENGFNLPFEMVRLMGGLRWTRPACVEVGFFLSSAIICHHLAVPEPVGDGNWVSRRRDGETESFGRRGVW